MIDSVAERTRFGSLALLVVVGTWLGHGVEYGLVAGWRGVALGLWGPLHSYMLPAALLLSVAAFVLALRLTALSRALQQRADGLWRQLRHGVRAAGRTAEPLVITREPRPFALALGVASAQICLYVVQENVEAAMAGARAPGLSTVTGSHWTAAFVQIAFAVWLALGWLRCNRALRRRTHEVARLETVIRAISHRRRSPDVQPTPRTAATASPWSSRPRASRAPPLASPA